MLQQQRHSLNGHVLEYEIFIWYFLLEICAVAAESPMKSRDLLIILQNFCYCCVVGMVQVFRKNNTVSFTCLLYLLYIDIHLLFSLRNSIWTSTYKLLKSIIKSFTVWTTIVLSYFTKELLAYINKDEAQCKFKSKYAADPSNTHFSQNPFKRLWFINEQNNFHV